MSPRRAAWRPRLGVRPGRPGRPQGGPSGQPLVTVRWCCGALVEACAVSLTFEVAAREVAFWLQRW